MKNLDEVTGAIGIAAAVLAIMLAFHFFDPLFVLAELALICFWISFGALMAVYDAERRARDYALWKAIGDLHNRIELPPAFMLPTNQSGEGPGGASGRV